MNQRWSMAERERSELAELWHRPHETKRQQHGRGPMQQESQAHTGGSGEIANFQIPHRRYPGPDDPRAIRRQYTGAFSCSMLAARGVYQDALNHKHVPCLCRLTQAIRPIVRQIRR